MKQKRATRHRCNDDRAFLSLSRDYAIVAEYERVTTYAALIIGIAFGMCLFIGLVF